MIPCASKGITFTEVPDHVAVFFEIGNCQRRCKGCHSQHLWKKIPLTPIDDLVKYAETQCAIGANAIVVMGGEDNEIPEKVFATFIQRLVSVAPVCLYTARDNIPNLPLTWVKTGAYMESLGGLGRPNTNQRFYQLKPEFKEVIF